MPLPSTSDLIIPAFCAASMFECDLCRTDLSLTCRIHCAVCEEFDLCLDCFIGQYAAGRKKGRVEPGGHDPLTHGYVVADCPKFPLLQGETPADTWTAEELCRLLTGISSFGLGNWVDVAEHVGTKSAQQCGKCYLVDFCGEYGAILPKSIVASDGALVATNADSVVPDDVKKDYFQTYVPAKATRGELVPNAADRVKKEAALGKSLAMAKTPEEAASIRAEAADLGMELPPTDEEQAAMPGAELSGYMVRRGDFDIEWDNDAEHTIADMEFSTKDTAADRELKLSVLNIYNRKLKDRQKRKAFAKERGLLNYRAIQMKNADKSKEEREMIQRMRIFERYSSVEEHDELVRKLIEAKRIRAEIEKLQMYRVLGMESMKEAEEYEAEKKRRAAGIVEDAGVGESAKKKLKTEEEEVADEQSAMKALPGASHCSAAELKLCSDLSIQPSSYLIIKDQLITAMLSRGTIDKTTKSLLSFIDVGLLVDEQAGERILEFVVKAGWAKTRPGMV
jgi:transcriptional adapter 2-alpha